MFAIALAIYAIGLVAILAILTIHAIPGPISFHRIFSGRKYRILRTLFLVITYLWFSPILALLGQQVYLGDPDAYAFLVIILLPILLVAWQRFRAITVIRAE